MPSPARADSRRPDQLRPLTLEAGIAPYASGSVLIGFGAATSPVFLGIAAYRMVHYWLPIPGGVLAYTLLRARPAQVTPPAS